MRKIIPVPVILILGILLFGAALWLWYSSRSTAMEQVLPSDPLVFVRLSDLEKNWTSFSRTDFWGKCSRIDWRRFWKITGASDQNLALYDALQQSLSSPSAGRIFRELLARDIALAVYANDETSLEHASFTDIFSRVVFVARLKPGRQALDLLVPLLAGKREDLDHTTVRYLNHDIHTLKIQGADVDLVYTRLADLLIIGISPEMPKRCLRVAGEKDRTLAGDASYRKVQGGFLKGADMRGFVDLGSLAGYLKENVIKLVAERQGNQAAAIREQLGQNMNQIFGFRFVGFSGAFDSFYRAKADLYYDTHQVDPRLFAIDNCDPSENKSLTFMPADVLSYQWSTCYDFEYLLKQAQTARQPAGKKEDKASDVGAMASLQKKINISLADDIIPLLGQEIGNAVFDVDTSGAFPIPRMLLYISIKDTQAAENMLKRLTSQLPLLRLEEREYRGRPVRYLTVPVASGLQPGFVFINNYLILATHKSLLEKCLDSSLEEGGRLTENRFFQDESLDLQGRYNSLFYLNVAELVVRAQKVMEWGHAWLKQQEEKRAAFRQGQMGVLNDVRRQIEDDLEKLKERRAEIKEVQPQKEEALLLDSQMRDVTGSIRKWQESRPETEETPEAPEIAEWRQRLENLQAQKDRIKPPLHKIRQMESQAVELENRIEANRDKQKEIEKIIETTRPDETQVTEQRAATIKAFLQPMLKAFSDCEMFSTKLIFQKGLIQGHLLLKLH